MELNKVLATCWFAGVRVTLEKHLLEPAQAVQGVPTKCLRKC